MFLVAGLAPAVAGFAPLLPAANAQSGPAQDANGNPYSQTPSTCGAAERYSIEGRVFDDNGGGNWNWNPTLGDVGLGGQTVKLRYTATNSSGPVSEWYTTTTTADGSYCIRVADDFNPTALESSGSRIQIVTDTNITAGGSDYVLERLPGDGNFMSVPNLDSTNNNRSTESAWETALDYVRLLNVIYRPRSNPLVDPVSGAPVTYETLQTRPEAVAADTLDACTHYPTILTENCQVLEGWIGLDNERLYTAKTGGDAAAAGVTVYIRIEMADGSTGYFRTTTDADGYYSFVFP
ncbi:hypothetical protein [Dietzia sp. NCCP-2495]|uniref:hypothetical protein n=1 Tax=Dietzia sp. NCCP-2495 TaxID=2934675 RepID=UPI00222F21CB|nr:hypothetical protein [Dietzia sp. NCCP-2495]